VLLVAALGVILDVGYWSYERFWRRELRVTFFDVGQGSSALLELPRGHNVLLDGGGFADNASFDTGKYIIAPYLLQRKIKTVHTIFLTHPNSDHLNGLIYIARHFNVRRAITNNEPSQTQGYRLFMEALENNDIELPRYQDMQRVIRIGDVSLEILYPVPDFLERTTREKWRNKNNNSLVVRVSLGRHSFLFPGDIMNLGEKELVLSAGNKLRSTVLMAPHHGSNTSSSLAFLQQVKPDLVVVSCGWRNRYNFPAYQVLRRYEEMDCRVVRTDLNGAVIMKTNGDDFTIRTHNDDNT
jgi:competence protein ComEC